MKRILLLFITLLVFDTTSYAQGFEWVKAAGYSRRSGIIQMVKDDYNNIISTHSKSCGMACINFYLKKTDSLQNTVFYYQLQNSSVFAGPWISSIGTDFIGNIYVLVPSIDESNFSVGPYLIVDSNFFNVPFSTWDALLKFDSSGNLLWYKVLRPNPTSLFDLTPDGKMYGNDGSVYDSSGTLLISGVQPQSKYVKITNSHYILAYSDSIVRLSANSGILVSSFPISNGIQALAVDVNGDIYIGDTIGLKKYDSSNNLVWQNNIGEIFDVSISPQHLWASVQETEFSQGFITKIQKSNLTAINTDSLKNSTEILIEAIDDNNAYVGSNIANDPNGSPYSYVLWPPLIAFSGSPILLDNFLGKYSSNISTTSLNFDDSFAYPLDNQGGFTSSWFCQGSPPFPVGYTLYNGTFGAGAQVIAELSDSSGSFSNPVLIGLDFPSGNKDTIYCQIPTTTISGNNYRIRLRCTVPALTSPQTIGDLTFYSEAPIVSASGPTTFCNGDSVTLTAINTNPFNPLQWSTGDTTSSITVTADGNYFASVSSGMCTYASPSIIVNAEPNLIDVDSINGTAGIINGQPYGYSVTPDPNATNYQWVTTCGNVVNGQGTNGASIIWNTANPCNLTVIVSNAACTDTATITVYPLTGTQETATASPMAYLFPNPAKEILNVRFSTPNCTHLIELVDVQGRLMERLEVISQSQVTMNTDALAAGTYYLNVKRNEETSTMMFVKQ